MRTTNRWTIIAALLAVVAAPGWGADAAAAPKKKFRIAWAIYVGWMPWGYAQDNGIIEKWADKYGIELEMVQINDYIESINQYTAGAFDGGLMTNMDALKEAHAFATSPELVKTMELVRTFSFDHGLMGSGAKSVDAIGMEFPGGTVLGDRNNIKLRFDPTWVKMAADGQL